MERVERLTNLLALLLETREPLTLVQIAGALAGQYPDKDANRRAAFERDKAALRDIGVPIETEVLVGQHAGSTGYWIDRDRYELADLELDDDERRALQVAVATIRPTAGQDAVWKLGADALDAGSAPVTAFVPDIAGLPGLREAATRRATVRFDYRGKSRTLDPYGLLLRNGFWYVVGRDHEHDEQRTYRVDRIERDVDVGRDGSFERPPGVDLAAALPVDPKLIGADDPEAVALVLVDGPRAAQVERELGVSRVVARHDGGAIEVEVPCANHDAFRSWVLGLHEHAEVLAPPDRRADIIEWLRVLAGGRAAPTARSGRGRR
ncbi:MAG: helix-turn-helix transcriptional regulator [Desertimonas sp.]